VGCVCVGSDVGCDVGCVCVWAVMSRWVSTVCSEQSC